jgi:hypothetical protein
MNGLVGDVGARSGVVGTTQIDYEEGTWTITNSSQTPGGPVGVYTRIGDLVYISGYFASGSGGTSSDTWGGLPFTIANSDGARGGGGTSFNSFNTAETFSVLGTANSTNFKFYLGNSAQSITSSKDIYFFFVYKTLS